MSFEDREKQEKEYIRHWLSFNPGWNRNTNSLFPDFTKPDGSFQDIKFMTNGSRGFHNLICQKTELDRWNKTGISKHTELKFVCPDYNIYIIDCTDFLINIDQIHRERLPEQFSSGEEFYLLFKNKYDWKISGWENFKANRYIVRNFVRK